MPVQRTISPANYLTPTDKEIVDAINRTFGNPIPMAVQIKGLTCRMSRML